MLDLSSRFRFFHSRRPRYLRRAVEIGCALGLVLTVVLSAAALQYEAVCRSVCRDTLRLHVLANSDALPDQMQKLAVRDAILDAVSAATANAASKEEAVAAVQAALPTLQAAAQQAADGCAVRLRLVEERFAAKNYDSFRLPAGTYTALRVEIGRAAGHNWFCVLYPALCVGSSEGKYDETSENALVFGGYQIRSAFLDTLRTFCQSDRA